jgi:hypothetical protein
MRINEALVIQLIEGRETMELVFSDESKGDEARMPLQSAPSLIEVIEQVQLIAKEHPVGINAVQIYPKDFPKVCYALGYFYGSVMGR